ncbi:MAG: twin-arginine translocase TatA/TatE family subunit [bacterium]
MNFHPAIIPGMAGWSELLLILALALILFGPKRLPEIAEAMGKSIRKFKSATRDATEEVKKEIEDAGKSNGDGGPSSSDKRD